MFCINLSPTNSIKDNQSTSESRTQQRCHIKTIQKTSADGTHPIIRAGLGITEKPPGNPHLPKEASESLFLTALF